MWTDTDSTPARNISLSSNDTRTFFITETYEIYYDYLWNSINGIHVLDALIFSSIFKIIFIVQ